MNKQELINKFREIGIYSLNIFGTEIKGIPTESAICLIEQLDEPEKVKVPQCVHKYIQEAKEYKWDLQDLMKSIDDEDSEELQRWFYHECNQETLARAWLDGYEIEKEKRYFVKITAAEQYLVRVEDEDIIFNKDSEYHKQRKKEKKNPIFKRNKPRNRWAL